MKIGKAIQNLRKENKLSQEEFGKLFYVTRQTVSNWENEKSYPDLHTLVKISDIFDISLDKLLKEDIQMVESVSKTFMNGMKWDKIRKTVFTFITLLIVILLTLSAVYAVIWYSQKKKLENNFNAAIAECGFHETPERYYELDLSDNILFILPHQEMPPFFDLSLGFHSETLDGYLKTDEGEIWVRWNDTKVSSLNMIWQDANKEDQYFELRGNDISDNKNIPGELKKIIEKNQEEYDKMIAQGNIIYKKVYT